MSISKGIISLFFSLLLAGCQILPEPQNVVLYRLPSVDMPPASGEKVDWSLRISTPRTSDALAGNRLMVMDTQQELSAYAGIRWESSVPELWRDHLHKTVLADGRITSVSTTRENLMSSRELLGTLRDFQAELNGNGGEVVIRYDAVVANTKNRSQLARKTFAVREPVSDNSASTLIAGFGRAAQQLSTDLVNWLVTVESK